LLAEKTSVIVSERRVKCHIFEPSKRQLWTVVGMGKEHWLAPELDYCSCEGFYFGKLKGKKSCYHLDSVKIAQSQHEIEYIEFSDEEYLDFVKSLLEEI
jgi:predicted nucleic acid-binding Zn finger protein